MLDEDDGPDSYDGPDFDDYSYEDERRAARGTADCDGLCIPQCDWCLVGHVCPDECAPGPCPYEELATQAEAAAAF